MSQRVLFKSQTVNDKFAKVYSKNDFNEYVVKFYQTNHPVVVNKHLVEEDYYTDDLNDAFGTARMV